MLSSHQMVLGTTSIGLYVLAAMIAALTTAVVSLFTIQPWVHGDSPAYALMWAIAFLAEGVLLIPLCLSFTAELIEWRVQKRTFRWAGVGTRFLPGLFMSSGPAVTLVIWGVAPSSHPTHWLVEEVAAYCVSVTSGILVLGIRRRSEHTGV